MTLRHITNFSKSQIQHWVTSSSAPLITGLDYGVIGDSTVGPPAIPNEIHNLLDVPPTFLNTTIDFHLLFDGTTAITDLTKILLTSAGGSIGSYFQFNNTVINTVTYVDSDGNSTRYTGTTVDTTNGNHFKLVTNTNGECTVYWDNIQIMKLGVASAGTNQIYIELPTTQCKMLGFRWYDQAIYPPDELPDASVSNGTLYCTDQEVRNAGRFRNKVQLPVQTSATTYVHKNHIEHLISLIKVNKSTGATTQLVQVKSSPATGQYVFTSPSTFVFGDTTTDNDIFWAEIEEAVYSNEIADCRAEAQAVVDSILAAKFSAVPLTPSTIYTQVRKSVAELTALIILRRQISYIGGKDLRNIDTRYNQILSYLTNLEIFTLNDSTYVPNNPGMPTVSVWQQDWEEVSETRKLYWDEEGA